MYANGFLEERRRSPASLVAVIGLHAAALGAVIAFGTTTFLPPDRSGLKIITIRPEPPVPQPDPPPRPNPNPPRQIDQLTAPRTDAPPIGPTTSQETPPRTYQEPTTPPGPTRLAENTVPTVPPPVRRAASVDPNYRDALQPPYPRPMLDAQRDGSVRVRITIGTDGRVSAIERLSSSDDAFWRVTERQARGRWRFRPATVDGRPIESTMVMTVTFRIPDA